jgi:hypothetical protein
MQITTLSRHIPVFADSEQAISRLQHYGCWVATSGPRLGTSPIDGLLKFFGRLYRTSDLQ